MNNRYEVALLKLTPDEVALFVEQVTADKWPDAVTIAQQRANPEGLKVISRAPQKQGSVKFEVVHCKLLSSRTSF